MCMCLFWQLSILLHKSNRVMAKEIGIPRTTILRILNKMKYHLYHVMLTQALSQEDMQLLVRFCHCAQMIKADSNFFYHVLFFDKLCLKIMVN